MQKFKKKIKILKSSGSKSCDLDPIPTSLVKEWADIFITPITKIVNYSIKEGSFPNCFKMAYVTPLQKKPSLDRNILKNYRPVSNLSFISKLIEKVVAKQLNEFISREGLLNVNQSADKSSHSTETDISKFKVIHHLYADDTQIYLVVDSRNFDSSMEEMTKCLKSVQKWMDGVKLKLNPEITEFFIIEPKKPIRESLAPNFPVSLFHNNISPSVDVKNLDVIFDSDNSFDNHVAKVCRACYYHLRDLRRIRKFLSVETAMLQANTMVSSLLDYCNSLLYGVSKSNIAKLQRVQNDLCHIIFRLDKMSHVTPFLKKLHWLPIQHCILFKYNLLVYKAINLSALIRSSSLTRGNRLSPQRALKSSYAGVALQ